MNKSTYTFEPIEIAIRELHLDSIGPIRWLVCVGYEVQNGRGLFVGTMWSVKNDCPVRAGKNGEIRRMMGSRVEAMEWFGKATGEEQA